MQITAPVHMAIIYTAELMQYLIISSFLSQHIVPSHFFFNYLQNIRVPNISYTHQQQSVDCNYTASVKSPYVLS